MRAVFLRVIEAEDKAAVLPDTIQEPRANHDRTRFEVDPEDFRVVRRAPIVSSAPFGALVGLQLARTELAQSYEVGLIQRTPVPTLDLGARNGLAAPACRACSLKRAPDTRTETSRAFVLSAPRRAVQEMMELIEGKRLVTVDVTAFFSGRIETPEQLEAALVLLRQRIEKLLGEGKKVLIQ